jgi:HD superfamily phosphohydrolase
LKRKIINDPLYGFVSVQNPLIADVISHPWFQRLRHIRQLGLADLVYPGAGHSRFQHALGAYHLMGRALESLRNKGVKISAEESEAVTLAILLHDIGHGPLSHALEETLLPGIKHESITYRFLLALNEKFGGRLELAMQIFRDGYKRHFFHQLVSGQIDIDRLDYLSRDSFFTGVREGVTGVDRIIDMLNVHQDQLVVEEKAVYSMENFITARRLMYWQVYLHKTAISAERMVVNMIRRAQYLAQEGHVPNCAPALMTLLSHPITLDDFSNRNNGTDYLQVYSMIDDHDIWSAIKQWQHHSDKVLSTLAGQLLSRKIFKIRLDDGSIRKSDLAEARTKVQRSYKLTARDAGYLVSHGSVSNEAYVSGEKRINILMKNGSVADLATRSELPQIAALSRVVKKNFLCVPKNIELSN